jgi:hypothetical protein
MWVMLDKKAARYITKHMEEKDNDENIIYKDLLASDTI